MVSEQHSATGKGGQQVGVAGSDVSGVLRTARERGQLPRHVPLVSQQVLEGQGIQ